MSRRIVVGSEDVRQSRDHELIIGWVDGSQVQKRLVIAYASDHGNRVATELAQMIAFEFDRE